MSTALSKRQQARNEKTLKELVQNVAGNNICADCHARNPAWASWSLGVFLCMRCAAIHRKLGTHISKVKSLSMDSWTNEQVDNMRKVGNAVSNQIYNPERKKPPVSVDVDEADSAMERFIRAKYMNNNAGTSQGGKHTRPFSDEGVPPPLPPKNSSKFSLRSAASIFPSRLRKDPTPSPTIDNRPSSHGSAGKVTRVFGASVNYDDGDDTERKLAKMRDMGFNDAQRNAIVLKGVNGNLERAIESMVRLGEGGRKSPGPAPPPHDGTLRTSKSMTPLGGGVGLSLNGRNGSTSPRAQSNNPFDAMSLPAPLQTAQSTGNLQNNNPYQQSYQQSSNPFQAPQQQTDHFAQAFQQLDISAAHQAQPLFPNRTGGLTPQAVNPPPFPPHMAPSAPASPHVYQQMGFQTGSYSQPAPLQQQATGYNPFLNNTPNSAQSYQTQCQYPAPHNQHVNTGSMPQQHQYQQQQQQQLLQEQHTPTNNPFAARSPTRVASPTGLGQIPEQTQTSYQSAGYQSPAAMAPQAGANNPFFTRPAETPNQMYGQQGYYQPPRQDTASIMALYGLGGPQHSVPTDTTHSAPIQSQSIPEGHPVPPQQHQEPPPQVAPQRSATQPLPQTTNNPFMPKPAAAAPAPNDPFSSQRHISRESVNLGMDMAWNNGRHSPDAFASLSARHG